MRSVRRGAMFVGKPSAWVVLDIATNNEAAKTGRILKQLARRACAGNATDLNHPALPEYKALQLDAAYARAMAICADEKTRGGGVFPPTVSCVAAAKAWAR